MVFSVLYTSKCQPPSFSWDVDGSYQNCPCITANRLRQDLIYHPFSGTSFSSNKHQEGLRHSSIKDLISPGTLSIIQTPYQRNVLTFISFFQPEFRSDHTVLDKMLPHLLKSISQVSKQGVSFSLVSQLVSLVCSAGINVLLATVFE